MSFLDRLLALKEGRTDVDSRNGVVLFNYLQQSVPEAVADDCRPAVESTDPWGITEPN